MSKPQVAPPGGRRRKKQSNADLFRGADDEVDEYHRTTWTKPPPAKTQTPSLIHQAIQKQNAKQTNDNPNPNNHKTKPKPKPPPLPTSNVAVPPAPPTAQKANKELLYRQLNNRSKKRNPKAKQRRTHQKSNSAIGSIRNKFAWKPRSSSPGPGRKKTAEKSVTNKAAKKNKNIIIKVRKTDTNRARTHPKHTQQKKKGANHNKHSNVIFDIESEQQILGDILIHNSSWNHLTSNSKQPKEESQWKKIYSVLDRETICFWDNPNSKQNDDDEKISDKQTANITIYLSEILTLSKSIRSIDGEKYIIELNVCGKKCLLGFANIEQREYWHSLLSDYHLNYFVWRSTPLDESHRRSQNVIHGVYKLLKSQKHTADTQTMDTTQNILYIEEILQKISDLNITQIIDIVPAECRFMSGRLIRVIMSIKFFFMSVLKSLSGADIPLPSRDLLMRYLGEIADIEWAKTSLQILDFYCDKCYRIMFHLSFAFTSNARDEIMKLNEYITHTSIHMDEDTAKEERQIAEMKFEYESLQRSWKMHRDRLQEYVMAYRDAVAKLKHSYHQRDGLCKKIEALQNDNKQMNESMMLQNKTYSATIKEAQKLTQKFAILSQQMQNQIIANTATAKRTMSNGQYPLPSQIKTQQQRPKKTQSKHNKTSSEIQQISQQMTDLFKTLNVDKDMNANDTDKYSWI